MAGKVTIAGLAFNNAHGIIVILSAIAVLLTLLSGVWIHRSVGLNLSRISIGGLFWYSYCTMVAGPAIWISSSAEYDRIAPLFLATVIGCLLATAVGVWLTAIATQSSRYRIRRYLAVPPMPSSRAAQPALYLFILFALGVTLLYFVEAPSVPLLYAIRNPGDASKFVTMRQEAFAELDSPFRYLYAIVRQTLWPLLAALSLLSYKERPTTHRLILVVAVVAVALLYASASLIRGPAAVILIMLLLSAALRKRGGFRLDYLPVAASVVLVIPIAIIFLFSPDRSLGSVLESVGRRMVVVPTLNGIAYVEAFSSERPLLLGRSIDKVAVLVGAFSPSYESFNATNYIFRREFPDSPVATGSAPAPFYADAFANFGLGGALLFGLAAGVLMQLAQAWLLRLPRDPLGIACYAGLLYSFWELNRTALPSVLLTYGAVFTIAVYYLFRAVQRVLRSTTTLRSTAE